MTKQTVNRLKKYLVKNKLTYKEFASKVGISASSVCLWVNHKACPQPSQAVRIAKVTRGEVPLRYWGYIIIANGKVVRK